MLYFKLINWYWGKEEAIRFSPYDAEVNKVIELYCRLSYFRYVVIRAGGFSIRFYFLWRWQIISKDLRVNEDIRTKEVRLVDDQGQQLGIMSPREAVKIAMERGYDLVEVAPNAKPPVCRIMDYGKYKYEQSKKEREARKNQRIINIKEVKLRPNIEDHDFMTKTKNAIRFLKNGDKVKVTIMFRGREITHPELGKELCLRLANEVKDLAKVEKEAKVEGRNMIMVLSPIKD